MIVLGRGGALVDKHSGIVFELNAVATQVWSLLSEGHPARVICDRMASRYAVDRQVLERDITALLDTLMERGLITMRVADADTHAR